MYVHRSPGIHVSKLMAGRSLRQDDHCYRTITVYNNQQNTSQNEQKNSELQLQSPSKAHPLNNINNTHHSE